GDSLTLDTPTGERDFRVLTIGNDYLNAKLPTVYVSQDTLMEDFGVGTNVAVLINASPGASKAAVKNRLSRFISDYPQFAFYDTESLRTISEETFAQSFAIFYVLIAVLAIPSFIALLNTLAISVLARTRELGMLRAVGSTRSQVGRMVLAESLLLASVGVLFGVLGGVALGYGMVLAMNAFGYVSPYFFPWSGIVAAVVIGVGAAILAALIPARSASRLNVVEALHFE
ncbi:MAG: ABC transporter permease, partial [Coriobacteriales bacterium]|nr:ABC transporter permease [Coriobacteriales bacterium]